MTPAPNLDLASGSEPTAGLALVLYQAPPTFAPLANVLATKQDHLTNLALTSTSVISLKSAPETFFQFCDLPKNAREAVWKFTFPRGRLVEIIFKHEEFVHRASKNVTALGVHKESRAFALQFYPLSFSVEHEQSYTPFSFRHDTLFLGTRMKGEHIRFRNHGTNQDIKKVVSLIVDASLNWKNRKMDERGHRMCGVLVLMFSGVRNYVSLFTGNTDPLPAWASHSDFPEIPRCRWERTNGNDPRNIADELMMLWPPYCDQLPFTKLKLWDREAWRFGGIPNHEKWEPAIGVWKIPIIRVLGVDVGLIERFDDSGYWAKLVMDRCIDDLFD